ncbi:MAG: Gfo/Idh/MocA family oxidoreductase [Deinococcus sp.]|nr:Gfo/Idh/MocA family oxidoreductase [Deinococcus sp.]
MRVGMMSYAHLHAYKYSAVLKGLEGASLVAIADEQPARARQAAKRFEVEQVYSDYQELLDCSDIDAVVICSPNAQHAAQAVAAARAGKHILCEKPLATTVADAQRMIAAAQQAGVILQTAFVCRYDWTLVLAREKVLAGAIGKPLALSGFNRGNCPPGWFTDPEQAGGGAVLDHSVHLTDLFRWFLDDEVEEVYAQAGTLFHPKLKVDDCGLLSLRFRSGVIASVDPSWSRPPSFPTWGDFFLTILGTKGVLSTSDARQVVSVYGSQRGRQRLVWEPWGADYDQAMVEDFIASICQQRPPHASGEDGLRALEIALAAYQSAKSGRPVRLRS